MPEKPPDFLDAAIAAVDAQPKTVDMLRSALIAVSDDGRPVVFEIPRDITADEGLRAVFGLVQFIGGVRAQQEQQPKPRLEVAHVMPT